MTRIAVVVPVYNGARYLDEALSSVASQSLTPDEVVVVDDGSIDGSATLARDHRGVQVIMQENAGCAAARNRGIAETTAPLIAFLDADDIWHRERLARARAALVEQPAHGFVICAHRNFLTPELEHPPAWITPEALTQPQHAFGTGTLMVRRDVFARIGGFDPAMHPLDDTEWLSRAVDAGVRHGFLEEVLVQRRIHVANLTGSIWHSAEHGRRMAALLHASLQRRRAAARET